MTSITEDAEQFEDDAPCPKCGSYDTEWETCWHCGGQCEFDCHDEDAINFAPGEQYETCQECQGKGGFVVCHGCIAKARREHQAHLESREQ